MTLIHIPAPPPLWVRVVVHALCNGSPAPAVPAAPISAPAASITSGGLMPIRSKISDTRSSGLVFRSRWCSPTILFCLGHLDGWRGVNNYPNPSHPSRTSGLPPVPVRRVVLSPGLDPLGRIAQSRLPVSARRPAPYRQMSSSVQPG